MKIFVLLLILLITTYSHIYSSKPKITYGFDSTPKIYHIFISLDTGLGTTDYIKFIWPETIHNGADKSVIKAKLVTFINNLEVANTSVVNQGSSSSTYYITFNNVLLANKWYEIQLFPTKTPTMPSNLIIQLQITSDYSTNYITYDSNYALAYLNIENIISTSKTLSVVVSSTSVQKFRAGSIYQIEIALTPTISRSTGGNFTIEIYYDSTHTNTTSLLDFSFMGLCQSIATSSNPAITLNQCILSQDFYTITFSVNSITAGQTITISTQINNPIYVSKRGIRSYYVDFISGIVVQNGQHPLALEVKSINIEKISTGRIYLMWGIDIAYNDSTISQVPLYKASGTNIGPYNSFNAGFSFSETSPISGLYRVIMKMQGQGILEGSIAHNLPSYQNVQVYCHYNTVDKQIQCQNVGAFIKTSYRYFISGKVYFDSSTSSTLSTFGDIEIKPILFDSNSNELNIILFNSMKSGDEIPVKQSKQFLDTSGYHNTGLFKIGNAQIISYIDNIDSLSSTANSIEGFLKSNNSTIGIIPNYSTSQQLLFLLKTNNNQISGSGGSSKQFTTKIMYNNKIINFQDDGISKGLDFVGYSSNLSTWSISYSPCHKSGSVVCQKFNTINNTKNTQIRVNQDEKTNFYGMYNFKCGQAYLANAPCSTSCVQQCNMFTGYGTTDYSSSIMSMRKVKFDRNYHSNLYVDENLLDFVIQFYHGSTLQSSALINAYTINQYRLTNIKASYVNYYENTNNIYNKGVRLPMMLRIAGGIQPSESLNATIIGVFFDDNIDASTFWNEKDKSYKVGCSTANCIYYPNKGLNNVRNDNWHTNRRVEFYNLPSIQNQFNLLVPVTPSSNRSPPITLTIAFFKQNKSIQDSKSLLHTLSVYRLFGPAVNSSLSGAIGTINSLTKTTDNTLDIQFTNAQWSPDSSTLMTYSLNTSKIIKTPPNNTFSSGYTGSISLPTNDYYGAGLTITCFYYNIFASSTLKFQNPPSNTAKTCTIFSYIYNEIQNPSNNLQRNNQNIYTVFCPIDSFLNLSSSIKSNIQFLNPQYPNIFTTGFNLKSVISYGLSDKFGNLKGYKRQTGVLGSYIQTCSTSKLQKYNPSSIGKQRATFNVSTPQITMKSDSYDGYKSFKVVIDIPSATISGSDFIISSNQCHISDIRLICTMDSVTSAQVIAKITYSGEEIIYITYFELQLYGTISNSFQGVENYILSIQLPQTHTDGSAVVFGSSYTIKTTYCSCSSSFTVGTTAYLTDMLFNNLQTKTLVRTIKSPIIFQFGTKPQRQTFFRTSYFEFNFGFLSQPFNIYKNYNNIRCIIYENKTNQLIISNLWKTLNLNDLTNVKLYPKEEILQPSKYNFVMICNGASVPNGINTNNMTLKWKDNNLNLQTAISITQPTNYQNQPTGTITLTKINQRFQTQGFKSMYSFQISITDNMDQNYRFYVHFHIHMLTKFDAEGLVECYTRQNAIINDTQALFTYCTFTNDHQLMVWNNRNITAGTDLFLDIYNIQQPDVSKVTTNQKISITIDSDDNYTSGIYGIKEINDDSPSTNTVNNIKIISTTYNTTYIRSLQTITIEFDTITSVSGLNLYILFPFSYAEWIARGQQLSLENCHLMITGTTINLATQCKYISKRILKIIVSSWSNTKLTLILNSITSPSQIPNQKNNQIKFNLFCTDLNQIQILYYSFTDYSKYLNLQNQQNLIDLTWKSYIILLENNILKLNQINNDIITIYSGYYSNLIELKQNIYPQNFKTTLEFNLTNYQHNTFTNSTPLLAILGTSTAYFYLAANLSTHPGLYSLQFNTIGDTNSLYTVTPPLNLVVSNKKCQLTTSTNSYTIPKGGITLPIIIDGINCIPVTDISLLITFNETEISYSKDLTTVTLNPQTKNGKLYIIVQHNAVSLQIGNVIEMNISISGTNAQNYEQIKPIILTIVDATTYNVLPTATALSAPTLAQNTATFSLECDQSSLIYWGLGIYPSILNTEALDFQARIISNNQGFQQNFTQSDDIFRRVYGIESVNRRQRKIITLNNLKSNTDYTFKYFCLNQKKISSDSQSISFTSLNYGAYLMKVAITFKNSITYQQYSDLSCSLSEKFTLPKTRILTQTMSYCDLENNIFYNSINNTAIKPADRQNQYIYNFYILPDYTIGSDTTNTDIKNSLSLHSFTTSIVTSTKNYLQLPELIQMQTQDIQIYTTPQITLASKLAGLNSVILKASVNNMNGFVVSGAMKGLFDVDNMTIPTAINIKKGLLSTNTSLVAVRMFYGTQNYNISLQFNQLQENTDYSFFYYATPQDPSLLATSSSVQFTTVRTLEKLIININWSQHIILPVLLTIIVLVY